jgi:PPP family 3-phenylpropionic acid transporter
MYLLYFGGVGILMPYLPLYFQRQQLNPWEIGLIQSVGPVATIVAPPLWGYWADRTGHPLRIIMLIGMGACTGLLLLLVGKTFPAFLLAWSFYSIFAAAMTPMLDTLAISHVQKAGGSYARLRMFGSLGFVISSSFFGYFAERGSLATLFIPLALLGGCTFASMVIGDGNFRKTRMHGIDPPRAHWMQRDVFLLFLASCLHWIASAPYHGMFSLHASELNLPSALIGISASLAVFAEVVVMFFHSAFTSRFSSKTLLMISFLCSAIRWLGLANATNGYWVIALNMIHGMTFGLFYVAAMSFLTVRIQSHVRGTSQAWFASG